MDSESVRLPYGRDSGRLNDIVTLKGRHRRDLAKLPFEEKIAVLIRMQKMAREMALAAGREFNGIVWGERERERDGEFSHEPTRR